MICGRADAASGPLNGGPGGGSAGAASVVWCRVLVERISIKWSKTDFSITIWYIRRMCRSLSGRWDAMSSQRAPSRARGALRSPSPEAPRRRARRRVAARGRGHWCRRRGGCPARDVRPNEGLGGRGAVLGFTVASEAPRGIPRGYSSRAHSTCAFWSVHSAHVVAIAITGAAASSPPQCCPVRRGSARRHGEQPVMGCN